MRNVFCILGVLLVTVNPAKAATGSMNVFTGNGVAMAAIPLPAIRKITYDNLNMNIDTGMVVQRPVGGAAGNVKVVFRPSTSVRDPSAGAIGPGAPAVSCRPSFVSVSLNLKSAGFVRMAVYNSEGKRVREFQAPGLSAGRHVLVWNDTDASGRPVAPGIYHIIGTVDRNPVLNATVVVQ